MNISYSIYNPGGNITALVHSLVHLRVAVAEKIMKRHADVEQVGFIMPAVLPGTSFHLEMSGGEFCANAARSAACSYMKKNNSISVLFSVSGFNKEIVATLKEDMVEICIPREFYLKNVDNTSYTLIDFQGIRFVVTQDASLLSKKETLIMQYVEDFPAVGFVLLERKKGKYSICPFVWVRVHDTVFPETACGSGTIAAALFLRNKGIETGAITLFQPSGYAYNVVIDKQTSNFILAGFVQKVGDFSMVLTS